MEKRLNKFGLSSPTRLELMIVLALALFIPFYSLSHSAGVLGTSTKGGGPTPSPTPITKGGLIDKFTIFNRCGNDTYRNDAYVCANGQTYSEGGATSCKSFSLWFQYAKQRCQPTLTPTPTKFPPKPSKTPTPTITRAPTPTRKPTITPTIIPTRTPTPTRTSTPTPSI